MDSHHSRNGRRRAARSTAVAAAALLSALAPAAAQTVIVQGTFSGRVGLHVVDDFDTGTATTSYVLTDVEVNGHAFAGVVELVTPDGEALPARGALVGTGTLSGETLTLASIDSITAPAEGVTAPAGDPFRTLVMLVDLADVHEPCPIEDVRWQWSEDPEDSLETWYLEQSYGRFHFDADVIGPLTIASSSGNCQPKKWANQADQIARTLVPDFDAYDTYYYVMPAVNASGGQLCPGVGGEAKGSRAWSYDASCGDFVFGHELGHNLGLNHSSTEDNTYGDQSCIMGGSDGRVDQLRHYNAPHKVELDWLVPTLANPSDPGSTYRQVDQSGLYSVQALETEVEGADNLLRIASTANTDYNISYRTATTHFGANLKPQYVDRLSIHTSSGLGFSTILRHQDSWGDPGYPTLWGDGETFSEAGFCVTQVQHTPLRSDVWISFECEPPPPACPAASPCAGGACHPSYEIDAADTGFAGCVDADGGMLTCPAGETVHLVTRACALNACCFEFPACFCPLGGCADGTYLECR